MTIPMWCMLAGLFFPYVWAGASLPLRLKQFDTIDLGSPREQGANLLDAGARVVGAQYNAWEALTVFALANLIAFMAGLDAEGNWTMAAILWVVFRLFHGVFYAANLRVLRIISFTGAFGMSLWIIAMAATI